MSYTPGASAARSSASRSLRGRRSSRPGLCARRDGRYRPPQGAYTAPSALGWDVPGDREGDREGNGQREEEQHPAEHGEGGAADAVVDEDVLDHPRRDRIGEQPPTEDREEPPKGKPLAARKQQDVCSHRRRGAAKQRP